MNAPRQQTVLIIFGTRPEAIKLFPVIRALAQTPGIRVRTCVTALKPSFGLINTVGIKVLCQNLDTLGIIARNIGDAAACAAALSGRAELADPVSKHMGPAFPLIGAGEPVSAANAALRESDALMVIDDGKPVGVITRHDVLNFLSHGK